MSSVFENRDDACDMQAKILMIGDSGIKKINIKNRCRKNINIIKIYK